MRRFAVAGLYLVTSEPLSAGRTTIAVVEAALEAGVRLIQLREKEMPVRRFAELAVRVRELTLACGALLIVNDRLDVAMSVNADGVHLGQDDFPIPAARRLAPDLILGASTHSIAEALKAQEEGASYVNIGPLFPTNTKNWRGRFLGFEGLREISAVVRIPFTVMGGIKREHGPGLVAAGARTIAVVTEVTAAPDVKAAAREILDVLH
jgi:thiamine-phosphate pyrophosphorylase